MPRVALIDHSDLEAEHAHVEGVIARSEYDRLRTGRRVCDLADAYGPACRLDQQLEPYPTLWGKLSFEAGEQPFDRVHVAGTLDLGYEEAVEVAGGLLQQRDDVAVHV